VITNYDDEPLFATLDRKLKHFTVGFSVRLVNNQYWRRLWTIQEMVLAPPGICLHGTPAVALQGSFHDTELNDQEGAEGTIFFAKAQVLLSTTCAQTLRF
jgi:hypothetical protein